MVKRRRMVKKKASPPRKSKGWLSFNALNNFIAEMRKVVWPSREEAIRLSIIVLAVSIAVGIILGALDYGFTQLAKLLLP